MIRPTHVLGNLLLVTLACHPSNAVGGQPGGNKAALLAEARHQYTLTRVMPAREVSNVPIGNGPSVGDIVVYSFEMHKNNNSSPKLHNWVGAFLSSDEYPGLGFGEGMNYVFLLDQGDENHRYVVVPSQQNLKPRYLIYDPNVDLMQGNVDPPLVVRSKLSKAPGTRADSYQIGGCVEGPCTSGHCSTTGVGVEYLGT